MHRQDTVILERSQQDDYTALVQCMYNTVTNNKLIKTTFDFTFNKTLTMKMQYIQMKIMEKYIIIVVENPTYNQS